MALPVPAITNFSRDAADAVVTVGGTLGNDVYAFWVHMNNGNVTVGGQRTGDGDINLDLTTATWTLFGTVVEVPVVVFVATTDGAGNFSGPCSQAQPKLLSVVSFQLSTPRRSNTNSKKITFNVSGLPAPSDEHKLFIFWNDRDENVYLEQVSKDNGQKTLTADFDTDWAYDFTVMGTDPKGSWLMPVTMCEPWSNVANQPPILDRVLLDSENSELDAYFTIPSSVYAGSPKLLYRDMSINESSWSVMDAPLSPTALVGLKRGHVYQLQMVMEDAQGKRSLPGKTVETKVTG